MQMEALRFHILCSGITSQVLVAHAFNYVKENPGWTLMEVVKADIIGTAAGREETSRKDSVTHSALPWAAGKLQWSRTDALTLFFELITLEFTWIIFQYKQNLGSYQVVLYGKTDFSSTSGLLALLRGTRVSKCIWAVKGKIKKVCRKHGKLKNTGNFGGESFIPATMIFPES